MKNKKPSKRAAKSLQRHIAEPAAVQQKPTKRIPVADTTSGVAVEVPIRKSVNREIDLTEKIFELKSQVDDLGRRSVPFVVECGYRLCQLETFLGVKRFKQWKEQHKGQISETTIKRWKRVYNYSVTSDLAGKTLMEVYAVLGITNGCEKKEEAKVSGDRPGSNDEPYNDGDANADDGKKQEAKLFSDSHQAFCLFIKAFEEATPEVRALTMIVVNEWLADQRPEAKAA